MKKQYEPKVLYLPTDVLSTHPDDPCAWYVLLEHGDIQYSFTEEALSHRCARGSRVTRYQPVLTHLGTVAFCSPSKFSINPRLMLYGMLLDDQPADDAETTR